MKTILCSLVFALLIVNLAEAGVKTINPEKGVDIRKLIKLTGLEEVVIGSVQELKVEMKNAVEKGFMKNDIFEDFVNGDMSEENYAKIDLHKNVVDKIVLVSPSGKPMNRESDLIDVWFDSGAMPYAQWHYPFENKEKINMYRIYKILMSKKSLIFKDNLKFK